MYTTYIIKEGIYLPYIEKKSISYIIIFRLQITEYIKSIYVTLDLEVSMTPCLEGYPP